MELLAVFVILFVTTPILFAGFQLSLDYISSQNVSRVSRALDDKKQEILSATQTIASSDEVIQKLQDNNSTDLTQLLSAYRAKYGVSGVTAIDRNGIVLTQMDAPVDLLSKGSNIYLRSAAGLKVANGDTVLSIESAKTFPLAIQCFVPVKVDGQMIGSILIRQSVDQTLALAVKNASSIGFSQLIAYSKDSGVVGTTFANSTARDELSTYFNQNSDWVSGNKENGTIEVSGTIYKVHNVKVPGLSGVAGGLLILSPYANISGPLLGSLVITFAFMGLSFYHHKRFRHPHPKRDFWIILSFFSVLMLVGSYLLVGLFLGYGLESISKPKFQIYNSVLSLQPSSSIFVVGSEQNVAVRLSSGGESVNAVNLELDFDPTVAKVTDLNTSDSFCDQRFMLKKTVDNDKGHITVVCGLPNPGYSGELGNVVVLRVRALRVGDFALRFSTTGNKVLANDGLGTNVLRKSTDGYYRVTDVIAPVSQTTQIQQPVGAPAATQPAPVLAASLTHPNSGKWYAGGNISMFWQPASGAEYIYALDSQSTSNLSVGTKTNTSQVNLTAPESGIYYFHLAETRQGVMGPVSNYKIMVDMTPPDSLKVQSSSTSVSEGETVRFKFSANDSVSGIQPNYYFKIDNQSTFLPVLSEPAIAFDQPGKHTVTVRVFDNAENYTDTSVDIQVKSESFYENIRVVITDFLTRVFAFTYPR
jgi:hypothetical protein